jgi:hypothetical protein
MRPSPIRWMLYAHHYPLDPALCPLDPVRCPLDPTHTAVVACVAATFFLSSASYALSIIRSLKHCHKQSTKMVVLRHGQKLTAHLCMVSTVPSHTALIIHTALAIHTALIIINSVLTTRRWYCCTTALTIHTVLLSYAGGTAAQLRTADGAGIQLCHGSDNRALFATR